MQYDNCPRVTGLNPGDAGPEQTGDQMPLIDGLEAVWTLLGLMSIVIDNLDSTLGFQPPQAVHVHRTGRSLNEFLYRKFYSSFYPYL